MRSRVFVLLALTGCSSSTCPREGCDALERRAGDSGGTSRVAGVVASESDVVANGCQECGFASATVSAWTRTGDATSSAAVREETASPPLASVIAGSDGRYSLALEVGEYWICSGIACFGATVEAGRTTTLNIKLINGVSSGFVALPGAPSVTRVGGIERPPA
jgi:hypothetical protein